ncbi:MAG: exodeoxyribonuclease VII small subunit [Clostridia bacterium]|nr:exodeoxyribonuclease VII small subunit [Clostridia bacterium]
MTARKKKPSFEEGMATLEALIDSMNEGELDLERSMKAYEEGMALVSQLQGMLDAHKKRIEQIDMNTGEVTPFEEKDYGVS